MSLKTRLYAAALAVLATGLPAGAVLYFSADDPSGDEFDPSNTKMYVRELRRFGGKAAVLFDEFNRWFAGLWEGKSLGITVACLTLVLSAVILAVAIKLPPERKQD